MRTLTKIVVAVSAFVIFWSVLIVGWGVWLMNGHGVSMSRLDKVRLAMTQAEVRDALGQPSYTAEDGVWYYKRATWCMIKIAFDTTGKVVEIDHDH